MIFFYILINSLYATFSGNTLLQYVMSGASIHSDSGGGGGNSKENYKIFGALRAQSRYVCPPNILIGAIAPPPPLISTPSCVMSQHFNWVMERYTNLNNFR